jgi:rhodanese-related sulfurtransferase
MSSSISSGEVAPLESPSSRLRLTIPKQNHIQIVSEELEELLRETPATGAYSDLTVIDVRGPDYEGGAIRGSVHLSFEDIETQWETVIEKIKKAKVTKIVFVCQCARATWRHQQLCRDILCWWLIRRTLAPYCSVLLLYRQV